MCRAFTDLAQVHMQVRFLNLRAYPLDERIERLSATRRLGSRLGWHLWVTATK
jgi:hypothetical protein